jgi:ketol-acid reductoisomerase
MSQSLRIKYGQDAPIQPLLSKTVVVIGYGAQGHAHALNLRDSGVRVLVSNRRESANGKLALEHGFELLCKSDAVPQADLVILAVPDEIQPQVYDKHIAPLIRRGSAVGFIHGFNIHYHTIKPSPDIDVVLVSPKAAGPFVRKQFENGGGAPCLVAVHQDATGHARDIALAWASGIGGGKGGIIETTFKDEVETDLFGEQAVLCGGLSALIKAGFDTLVDAGYPPEIAYFECLHEVKLLADLIHQGGLSWMRRQISSTALYGDLTRGPRIITEATRAEMRKILHEITSGEFAREFRKESEQGMPTVHAQRAADEKLLIESVGRRLRSAMPWIDPRTVPEDQSDSSSGNAPRR